MNLKKIIIGVLVIACSTPAIAQTNNSSQSGEQKHFAIYGGLGPNFYFNNLVIGKNLVNEFNYSIVGRFMWEPGHLLSLGIETGYYRLYTLDTPAPTQAHIANSAIPLQVVLSMKFLKAFYFNLSMGQSILHNRVNSETYGNFDANKVSVADFTGTLGYRRMLNNRFSIGAEAKYFYSSSFVDENIALVFVGGFRF
ncbi:MAG TPA: hypothetical protein VGN20_07450 [Mucilaginibacter sp.]|jgi:hypothetical protein